MYNGCDLRRNIRTTLRKKIDYFENKVEILSLKLKFCFEKKV